MMHRRNILRTGLAALGAGVFPFTGTLRADTAKTKKLLVYTRSQTFEHSVVRPAKGKTKSLVEEIVTELGSKHGFEVMHTKDGRIFEPDSIKEFDAFLFETTGDLTKEGGDKQPPMSPQGKQALLQAIAAGKGFVGCHCASDTFHSSGLEIKQWENAPEEKRDPYIRMIGGEFIRHGAQQKAWMRVIDKSFPGAKGVEDFNINEEWYSLKNFSPDLHVILVQDTQGMKGLDYERPNFPATWARKHEKGRVFYTSMGHREDVWENATFQQLLVGGLMWAFGRVDAELTPNLTTAAPKGSELPKPM
jgi:type 1 glutamine amidotransferase